MVNTNKLHAMKCPNCGNKISAVKTLSHYGIVIILDQCKKCGGVWVDAGELFTRRITEKSDLPALNIQKLDKKTDVKNTLFCPKDNSPLHNFDDPNWPKELAIMACAICGGYWFDHKELFEFDKYRRKKLTKNQVTDEDRKNKIARARILLYLNAHLANKENDPLASLAKFASNVVPFAVNASTVFGTLIILATEALDRWADYANATYKATREVKINKIIEKFDQAIAKKK